MSDVKRWSVMQGDEMGDFDDGEYVLYADYKALLDRLDQSQKALGIIYGLAERLPPDVEIAAWLREIQEVCGQVWTDKK